MALLSFLESTPQAYGLKVSNAAPPFSTAAGTSPAILAPHPRMNLMLSRRDAQDIAAYIATLAK